MFRLDNMSGRSLPRAHNRRDADLAAKLLACAEPWPRSLHRLSRSNTRSNARRQPWQQNRCNGERRFRSKPS